MDFFPISLKFISQRLLYGPLTERLSIEPLALIQPKDYKSHKTANWRDHERCQSRGVDLRRG